MADNQVAKDQEQDVHVNASNAGAALKNVEHVNREFQEASVRKAAHEQGISYIDLLKTPLNPDFLKVIPYEDAVKAGMVSFFKVNNKLRIAVKDQNAPETQAAIETLKQQGYEIELSLASASGITETLNHYSKAQHYKKIEIVNEVDESKIQNYEKEIANLSALHKELVSKTAEQSLNMIDIAAMKTGASDAHYEPEQDKIVVRFRIDGMLYKVFELDFDLFAKIANQIKYKSKMTLNSLTVPQDGRYEFKYNQKTAAVRVASIPTPHGEAFVSRYLISDDKAVTFEELGFDGIALTKIQKATKITHGMILITGPTGSGKSTTLYSMLNAIKTPENKTITLEDPVEYHLEGVTQSQIDEDNGYDFASGLRSVLRHDPDVVMLGEIRDLETAETASQASLTGHLLLSTLHTNSAIEAIPRLVNMGLPAFMVAPALHTLVGQRLVRKVCPNCSTLEALTESERKEFEEVVENLEAVNPNEAFAIPEKIPRVHGCEKCSNTGYAGRLVVVEVVTVSSEMKRLILEEESSVKLIAAARKEGIVTMREDGFIKVSKGLTTLEEVYRATNIA